MENMNLAL